MKNKKNTDKTQKRRILSVGPITSREELVHTPRQLNLRTELNLAIKRWRGAEQKAKKRRLQHEAALNAYTKGD